MKPGVSIITPTIPGREELLADAVHSVQAQTFPPLQHLIGMDSARLGPAVMRNFLLHETETDWIGFLDDDDLLDDDHVAMLLAALADAPDSDVVFSWHRTEGQDAPRVPRFNEWSPEAEAFMHAGMNVIPVTVIARRSALLDAGGFFEHDRYEDYSLWMRMMRNGCRFTVAPVETWTYRFLGGNRTWREA